MASAEPWKKLSRIDDLGRAFGQQQLGRGRADQAGAADDQEAAVAHGKRVRPRGMCGRFAHGGSRKLAGYLPSSKCRCT